MASVELIAAVIAVAYLFGSLPTGYLAGRFLKGIDIRDQGSGSTGATNVLRVLGKGPALAVFIIDVLKGVLAVAIARLLVQSWPAQPLQLSWLLVLAAFATLVGHSASVWLRFKGGKSVATGLGVLIGMVPLISLVALALFGVVLAISRIVSLASVMTAATMGAMMIWIYHASQPAYALFGGVASAYVIWRHRSNIERLLQGREPRLGQSLPTSEELPS